MARPPVEAREWSVQEGNEPINEEPIELIGFTEESGYAFDASSRTLYTGEADHENRELVPSESRELGEEESLGEVIEDVGERVGWEGLSEFAREHLEDEEE